MKKREIPALLRPKIMDLDYSVLAEMIRQQGRGRDKILAHITPQEADLLKRRGGRGSTNPATGLPEFEEDYATDIGDISYPEAPSQFPDLYPGGEAPGSGQETVFSPGAESYYQPSSYQPAVMPQLGAASAALPSVSPLSSPSMPGLPSASPPSMDRFPTTPQPGFMEQAGEQVKKYFTDPKQGVERALRAAGLVGTGLFGAMQSRKAGRQAETAGQELRGIGAPYRAMGEQLIGMGQRGEMTAPQQQALQRMRAQTQQQLSRAGIRGGTAAMQSEAAIQRQAEAFAQQNIDQGLKLLNISDQYTAQGIRAAYQGDADARNLAMRFFSAATQQIPQSAPGAVRTVPANQ